MAVHKPPATCEPLDITLQTICGYSNTRAYSQSKLVNILHAKELAMRFKGFSSSSPASFGKMCHRTLLRRATQLYIQASRTSPGNTSWIPTNPAVALMAEIPSSLTSYGPSPRSL
ncbi:hypothetical protein SELMODRAFT_432580 [Selaginella moellendorffii]|uniref:Uncharacterized protein n=1 Tax=Selaginella moellendorffii TaxID=88036 RepID=D8TGF7_SELML|nr:hypothetical protein SELMODRAFT_432580 [Selaginella moellendorffii]